MDVSGTISNNNNQCSDGTVRMAFLVKTTPRIGPGASQKWCWMWPWGKKGHWPPNWMHIQVLVTYINGYMAIYLYIYIYIRIYIYSHIAIVLGVVCQLVGLQIPCLQPMYYHCNCTRPRWIFACGMTSMALTCGPEAVTNDFQMENGHLWLIYLVKMVIFPRKLLVYQKVTQDSECK